MENLPEPLPDPSMDLHSGELVETDAGSAARSGHGDGALAVDNLPVPIPEPSIDAGSGELVEALPLPLPDPSLEIRLGDSVFDESLSNRVGDIDVDAGFARGVEHVEGLEDLDDGVLDR